MDDRALILKHILPLVPFDGWSDYALRQAGKRTGLDDAAVTRAFPKGISDCIEYFFKQSDGALTTLLSPATLSAMRVPERIEALMLARLDAWLPHREAVRSIVSRGALPWNTAASLGSLYHTVDTMWRLAGDASTDFNFYTKRATLAGVYSSTLLFWLNDTSSAQEETRAFLNRRLQNVADFGRWKKERQQAMKERFTG